MHRNVAPAAVTQVESQSGTEPQDRLRARLADSGRAAKLLIERV